jgi:SAM-dependent MidA family methyltransferase
VDNRLKEIIIQKIMNEGPLCFEQFMDMALYYPDLGYYARADTHIGRKGDYYTSPHLHPIMGAMIARQLIEFWEFMHKPDVFIVIEMGAGMGYLCKDIFDYVYRSKTIPDSFRNSLRYIIIEPFRHLREKQQRIIKPEEFEGSIKWLDTLPEEKIRGCLISNELLDSFPVHLIEMDRELKEIYVNFNEKDFFEEKGLPCTDEITEYLTEFNITLPENYRTEINLRIRDWLRDVSNIISEGFILTIDYGYTAREYYHEERSKGTLMCYYKHEYNENPYQNIGMQDITSHINFSSLKKWGEKFGFCTIGYASQGSYLVSLGIDEVIEELYAGSPDYIKQVSRIRGLIMPQGMGESHRVMIQYKGSGNPILRGFEISNQMERL